jgi:Ca2+-transporting ATPase
MAILPEEFPVVFTVFLALGSWRLSKKNVLTRKPSTIETLGSATVFCSDKTGTITQNQMQLTAISAYNNEIITKERFSGDNKLNLNVLTCACYASKIDTVDPMEKALFKAAEKLNLSFNQHKLLVKEFPLTQDLLAISRIYKTDNILNVYSKGAPETILKLCMLNSDEKTKELHKVEELAKKGYRVLGVAHATIKNEIIPLTQEKLELSYIGLIALEDPIRPEVPEAIQECYNAGIKIMMITGDYPSTAKSIAKQAGLKTECIISDEELNKLNDDELKLQIESVNVFARVRPEQKLRIVNALKANNEIVAMTGDGVNDAPALKAAHIGIAMGNKGTDVAREASSLVLLDDNFASIVSAIRLGRRIFDNLQKAMSYILAIHIPIIGLTLIPAFYQNTPLFLFPLHIVFMELIIDPICSIAFESEVEEKGIMNRPPRKTDLKFFGFSKISFSLIQGILLLITVLIVHFISIKEGHTEGEVRAIAFTSLIIGNIFLIITNLSNTRSFKHLFTQKSKSALLIIIGSLIILICIHSFKPLQDLFHFEYPGINHFIPSILASLCLVLLLEARKLKYFFANSSKS